MKILIISLCKEALSEKEFVDPLVRTCESAGHKCESVHHSHLRPGALERCDAALLSGTALADFDYLDYIESFDWIKEFEKPLIGICAGMQMLCLVHGSQEIKCAEIGMTAIRPVQENLIIEKEIEGYALHAKAVVPSEEFEILAESDSCAHIVKLKQMPHYGLLFHPEVRNSEILYSLLRIQADL